MFFLCQYAYLIEIASCTLAQGSDFIMGAKFNPYKKTPRQ